MRFQQIKDLLLYIEQVHQMLSRLYGRLERQADAERSRLLLAYLRGREDAATGQLHEYASQLGESVAETWLEQGISHDMLATINSTTLPADMDGEAIIALVTGFEQQLTEELSRMARECPTDGTAALLDALATLEQQRLTRFVHGVHRFDDM